MGRVSHSATARSVAIPPGWCQTLSEIMRAQQILSLIALFFFAGCAEEGELPLPQSATWEYFDTSDGLVDNAVRTLFEDKGGNIWIGTYGGVSLYTAGHFANFYEGNGLADNTVWDIEQAEDGDIWFATGKGIAFYSNGDWSAATTINGHSYEAYALCRDDQGVMWIGTSYYGLLRYDDTGLTIVHDSSCPQCNDITTIFKDSNGNVWVGTAGGLRFIPGPDPAKNTMKIKTYREYDGLPDNHITAIGEDTFGRIWVGTYEGREIAFLLDDEFVKMSVATSYEQNWITSFAVDDEGQVWIGMAISGVYRYDGAVMKKEIDHLPDDYIFDLLKDSKGNVWAGSFYSGLTKYNRN